MRKLTPFLFLGCILMMLASCSKEKSVDTLTSGPNGTSGSGGNGGNGGNTGGTGGTSDGSEVGSWTLVSVHFKSTETAEFSNFSGANKVVTTMEYTTANNSGTIKFDGSNVTATGLAYTMNSSATTTIYLNGASQTSYNFPYSANVPPSTNVSGTYNKIATDSIYINQGVFTGMDPSGTGTVQGIPSGYKLTWDGNKMYMAMNYQQTTNQTQLGVTQKVTINVSSVTTLQKQ